jgi:hypothetical protein
VLLESDVVIRSVRTVDESVDCEPWGDGGWVEGGRGEVGITRYDPRGLSGAGQSDEVVVVGVSQHGLPGWGIGLDAADPPELVKVSVGLSQREEATKSVALEYFSQLGEQQRRDDHVDHAIARGAHEFRTWTGGRQRRGDEHIDVEDDDQGQA